MVLGAFEVPPLSHLFVWDELLFEGTPFAVNKTVILILVVSALLCAFLIFAARRQSLVPVGIQNATEAGYLLVEENVSVAVMGEEGKRWTPFLATMFFWILLLNILEIIPGIQFPPASRIAIPAFLALQTWLIFVFLGFKHNGLKYVLNIAFPPGVPKAFYVILTPIELISVFVIRPFSLAVRLFANLMAGHLLLTVFALMTAAFWTAKWYAIALPLPFFMAIALTAFEILVAVLQAYIFTMLTAVYVDDSVHPAH